MCVVIIRTLPQKKRMSVILIAGLLAGTPSGNAQLSRHGYTAAPGEYIEATVSKYVQEQNITIFKYKNVSGKNAYFALVGKYGLSVRTTLGKKMDAFSYGGPSRPRTITRYRVYESRIIGNRVVLTPREYTRISRRTAHMKLLTGFIFTIQDKAKTKWPRCHACG